MINLKLWNDSVPWPKKVMKRTSDCHTVYVNAVLKVWWQYSILYSSWSESQNHLHYSRLNSFTLGSYYSKWLDLLCCQNPSQLFHILLELKVQWSICLKSWESPQSIVLERYKHWITKQLPYANWNWPQNLFLSAKSMTLRDSKC